MAGFACQGHPPWRYRRRRGRLDRFSRWAHQSRPTETMIKNCRRVSFFGLKVGANQIVRAFVATRIDFGRGRVDQVAVCVKGAKQSGFVELHAGLHPL